MSATGTTLAATVPGFVWPVLVLALVALSGVLAVAETALTHLGRGRAAALEEEGLPHAPALMQLLERRERVLNPILLLVLTCHVASATVVAVVAHDRYGTTGVVIGLVATVTVVFVLAEALPKTWALLAADRAALRVTPLVTALAAVAPLRWTAGLLVRLSNLILPGESRAEGPSVSEGELLALAGVAADDAVIDAEERELIENTIEFGDTIVREVMVPRPDMVTVGSDFRVGDAMEVAILNGLSRLPVQGEGIDDIVGVLHAKDLMRAERDGKADAGVGDYYRPAFFVPETKKVAELLREMQARRTHLAIVVDEYGGTAGLATLEDLIEELVGEIVDEYDVEEASWVRLPSGELRVNARLNLDDLAEVLHADLPEGDWDSVGGMLIGLLGHVPEEGESVEADGHRFTAERVQDRRIGRVLVSPVDL